MELIIDWMIEVLDENLIIADFANIWLNYGMWIISCTGSFRVPQPYSVISRC